MVHLLLVSHFTLLARSRLCKFSVFHSGGDKAKLVKFMSYSRVVIILFTTGYISLHFQPILLVKLGFLSISVSVSLAFNVFLKDLITLYNQTI